VLRILVLCELPVQLRHREAHRWLRGALATTAAMSCVRDVRLFALDHAEGAPRTWRWMAGIDLDDTTSAGDVLRRGPLADLLGDVRLVGMRPVLLIVRDDGERITA
jgi:hypothetical protein